MDTYDPSDGDPDMRPWSSEEFTMFDNPQSGSFFNQPFESLEQSPILQSPLFHSPNLESALRKDSSMHIPLDQKSLPRSSMEEGSSVSPRSSTRDSSESFVSQKRKESPIKSEAKNEYSEYQGAEAGYISPPTHSDRDLDTIGSTLHSSLAFNNSTPSSPLSNWMTTSFPSHNISPSGPEESLNRIAHISMPSTNGGSAGFNTGDLSRDGSPQPAFFTNQENSLDNIVASKQTSSGDLGFFGEANLNGNWSNAPPFGQYAETVPPIVQQYPALSPPQALNSAPEARNAWYPTESTKSRQPSVSSAQPQLWVSVEHQKTRVETQIQLKLVLSPCPPSISACHFPPNAITKPKNQASEKDLQIYGGKRGTLELSTSLVCNTPMKEPELRERAMRRARGEKILPERRSSTASISGNDDPDHPINGGEVRICNNCINRERKRAGRKRIKKEEDEKALSNYDVDKVIIFNDKEYKEWDTAVYEKQDQPWVPPQGWPEGARQVKTAMRITCYGRHQQEKNGFRVIFTLKDWEGNVVAQKMSMEIYITDDHKTPVPAQGEPQVLPGYTAIHPPQQPFRPYNSATNLAELSAMASQQMMGLHNSGFNQRSPDQHVAMHNYSASASVTPRSLSRSASPSFQIGPNKKRKGSFSGPRKIPASLQMSRIDQVGGAPTSNGPLSAGMSAAYPLNNGMTVLSPTNIMAPTPLSTSGLSGMGGQPSLMSPTLASGYNSASTGAFFSAPTSAHHSRAPSGATSMIHSTVPSRAPSPLHSPDMLRHPQDPFAHINRTMFSTLSQPQQNQPWISDIVSPEGPQSGGTQVACFGSNFSQGMTVMFGNNPSPSAQVHGPTALLCTSPPSRRPGPVPVWCTMPDAPDNVSNSQRNPNNAYFTYYPSENFDTVNLAIRQLNQQQAAILAAQQAAAASGLPQSGFMPEELPNGLPNM